MGIISFLPYFNWLVSGTWGFGALSYPLLRWFDGIFRVSLVQLELDLCVAGQREAEVSRLRCRLLGSLPQVACDSGSSDTHFCWFCVMCWFTLGFPLWDCIALHLSMASCLWLFVAVRVTFARKYSYSHMCYQLWNSQNLIVNVRNVLGLRPKKSK